MKRIVYLIVAVVIIALSGTSCASIVTRSSYPVDFNSTPQGAELTIENRDGRTVFAGRTPATVWLESSAGYMRPEHYKVTYRQPGAEPVTTWIEARIDGWYFGNLLLGGLVGMLLIDPLTGAMWRIPPGAEVVNVAVDPPASPSPPAPLAAPAPPAPPAPPTAPEAPAPTAPAPGWTPLGQ